MVQDAVLVRHRVQFPQHILAFEQAGTDLGADLGERDVAPAYLDSPAAEPVVRCSPASAASERAAGSHGRVGGTHIASQSPVSILSNIARQLSTSFRDCLNVIGKAGYVPNSA